MATTFVDYTGDGNATKSFSFPSIQESDVKVDVDGVIKTSGTHYNITGYTTTGGGSVVFTSGNIPTSPAAIRIFRDTNVDTAKATYTAGSSVKAADLNANHEQILFAAQEEQNQTILSSDIKDGAIKTVDLGDSAVTTAKLAADSVTNAKIADDSIDSEHYADGSIDTAHIADNQITTAKIADGAITSVKIANGTVGEDDLGAGAVVTVKISDNAVTTAKIADANVTTAKIADNNVTADKLAHTSVTAGSYTAADLTVDAQGRITAASSGAIATSEITDGAVTTAKIAADAIVNAKIADNAIDSEHYVDGSIDTEHIANDAVTTDKLANSIVADITANNAKVTNVTTNLTTSTATDSVTINSSDGTNATIGEATSSAAGVMSTAHHDKLDGIEAGATGDQTNAEIRAAVEAASDSNVFTDADHSKLNAIEAGATADQTNAEIRAAVEAASDSNVFTDADHSKLNAIEAGATADQTASEIKTLLQSDKLTNSEIATGTLDGRYYTETELDAGQLDNRYYTEAESDARYFNISTGDTIKDGDTFPDNDTTIATTAAINDRIIDLVDDVGGFVPIASETAFPTANPDVNNGSGTLVSIKAIGSTRTPSSGTVTISNGAGSNTVTITGCGSTVLTAGFGVIVETTSTLHTYAFHRLVPKATEVSTVAANATNIAAAGANTTNINTVAGINSNVTTVAGIASNVTTVAGVASNVTTVAGISSDVTAVANDASDIGAVAAKATEIGLLGTADAIADMNTLGTSAIVSDMDTLADISSNITTVANNSSNVTTVAGISGNVTTVAGISSNVTSVANNNSNVTTVAGSISNVNTTASNISNVNNFAATYQIASSAPSTDGAGNALAAGDLYFDTTANELRVHNGSTFQGGVTATGNLAGLGANTFTGTQSHGDNVKNIFGTGNDLQIWHDGSDSNIVDVGTGDLNIRGSTVHLRAGTDETFLKGVENAQVELHYDGSKKFETASGGVTVTGNITVSGTVDGVDIAALNSTVSGITTNATHTGEVTGSGALTIADGAVVTARLADNAVTSAKIANDSITANELANNSVGDSHIIDGTITNSEISGSAAIALTKLGTGNLPNTISVLTANIAAGQLVTGHIAAGTGFQISNSNVSNSADIAGSKLADGGISTAKIADDAVTADKLANSINTEIAANTAKTTNATHSGEVTGATALTIADNVVDEANLKVSNSPVNGYFLQAQSGNTGGLTWAQVDLSSKFNTTGGTISGNVSVNGDLKVLDDKVVAAGNDFDIYLYKDPSGESYLRGLNSAMNIATLHNYAIKFRTNTASQTVGWDIETDGDFVPTANKAVDIGSSSKYIDQSYLADINCENIAITSHIYVAANSNIGTSSTPGNNIYFDNYYGDGSNLTGVASAVADGCIYENSQTISNNYTITTNKNALSAGPITIANGVTLTIPTGSVYTIV